MKNVKKCSKEVMEQITLLSYIVWHHYIYDKSVVIVDAQMEDEKDAISYAKKLYKRTGIYHHVELMNQENE